MNLQMLTGWKCKMADNWIKLGHVQFPTRCLHCKKIILRGETAFWLPSQGLLHPRCGIGSKPKSNLLPIYTEDPAYDKNPFENIHEHTPQYYAAKQWRDSD